MGCLPCHVPQDAEKIVIVFKLDPPTLHPLDELAPSQPDLSGLAVPVMGQSIVFNEIPDALL
jgi:hypothetical protein